MPSKISPVVNIYSSYGEKIKGPVVLVIDNRIKKINQKVIPSTGDCSSYSYPVIVGDALASSIKATTDTIFEQVVEQSALPTKDEMQKAGIQGTIYVKLKIFYPSVTFLRYPSITFRSFPHGYASCDIRLEVTVNDSGDNNLLVTTARGMTMAEITPKSGCSGVANILSNAISQSMRETMEWFVEEVSNSDKIRNAFGAKRED
jgi:hypothetical protein